MTPKKPSPVGRGLPQGAAARTNPDHTVTPPTIADCVRAYVKLNRATRAVLALVEHRVAESGLTLTQLGRRNRHGQNHLNNI